MIGLSFAIIELSFFFYTLILLYITTIFLLNRSYSGKMSLVRLSTKNNTAEHITYYNRSKSYMRQGFRQIKRSMDATAKVVDDYT